MDENICRFAERIVQLHQKAYEVYLPLVEDVCSRTVSEDELSHLLDYLLDFACDGKILELYKDGTITKEMCNDWVNGVLSKYSKFTISKSTGIIPEHVEPDVNITDDDLPF